LINIDDNSKRLYYEIQKYFTEIKGFWDFIKVNSPYKFYQKECAKVCHNKKGIMNLSDYVPEFIKDVKLT